MVWKFCEIWKSYGKWGPEVPKFCEILSHSVRYGMYEVPPRKLKLFWGTTSEIESRTYSPTKELETIFQSLLKQKYQFKYCIKYM